MEYSVLLPKILFGSGLLQCAPWTCILKAASSANRILRALWKPGCYLSLRWQDQNELSILCSFVSMLILTRLKMWYSILCSEWCQSFRSISKANVGRESLYNLIPSAFLVVSHLSIGSGIYSQSNLLTAHALCSKTCALWVNNLPQQEERFLGKLVLGEVHAVGCLFHAHQCVALPLLLLQKLTQPEKGHLVQQWWVFFFNSFLCTVSYHFLPGDAFTAPISSDCCIKEHILEKVLKCQGERSKHCCLKVWRLYL